MITWPMPDNSSSQNPELCFMASGVCTTCTQKKKALYIRQSHANGVMLCRNQKHTWHEVSFHGSERTTNAPQTKVNGDHTTLHWQKSKCMIKTVTQSYSSRDQAGQMKIRLHTSRCTPCILCQEGRLRTKRKEHALLNRPRNDATATSKAKETPTNGLANHLGSTTRLQRGVTWPAVVATGVPRPRSPAVVEASNTPMDDFNKRQHQYNAN